MPPPKRKFHIIPLPPPPTSAEFKLNNFNNNPHPTYLESQWVLFSFLTPSGLGCTWQKSVLKLLSHLHYNSMLFTINISIFKKKHNNMLTSYNTQPSCPLVVELLESFAPQLQLQPFQNSKSICGGVWIFSCTKREKINYLPNLMASDLSQISNK